MKTFFLVSIISLIMSCNDNNKNNDNSIDAFNLDNQIEIIYKNSLGQNLLENSTKDSYNVQNMKLYYLIDNKPVEVSVQNGYNMGSIELTSEKDIKVHTNFLRNNIIRETSEFKIVENIALLELSKTETDTIKTHSKVGTVRFANGASGSYFIVSKVWYNDELVWDWDMKSQKARFFEIVK